MLKSFKGSPSELVEQLQKMMPIATGLAFVVKTKDGNCLCGFSSVEPEALALMEKAFGWAVDDYLQGGVISVV